MIKKIYGKDEEKKVGVAILKPTRNENSKGTRIGPSLIYMSELQSNIKRLFDFLINELFLKIISFY